MRPLLTPLAALILVFSCSPIEDKPASENPYDLLGQSAQVFMTAENTTMRLTPQSEVSFEQADQPREDDVYVFVNPNKTFQTFWGIAAITDASAEVFAKLLDTFV